MNPKEIQVRKLANMEPNPTKNAQKQNPTRKLKSVVLKKNSFK